MNLIVSSANFNSFVWLKLGISMENNPSSSSRTDRKTIERNRRNHMKALYSELYSLVSHQSSRDQVAASLPDQLDEAANYIKQLQTNLEEIKKKKDSLMGIERPDASTNSGVTVGLRLPQIEIQEIAGFALKVVVITGLDFYFVFKETVRVLHEEGAEIINAGFSVVEDRVFHTIHAKVGESAPMGYEAARISERLKKFVSDVNVI